MNIRFPRGQEPVLEITKSDRAALDLSRDILGRIGMLMDRPRCTEASETLHDLLKDFPAKAAKDVLDEAAQREAEAKAPPF